MPEVKNARFITKAIIAELVRHLKTGRSPKEIAMMTGESYKNIQMIILRYREVHTVFVQSYFVRNPHKETIPPKMANSLREV